MLYLERGSRALLRPIDCRRVFGGTPSHSLATADQTSEPFTKVIHILVARPSYNAGGVVPPYANSRLFPAIAFVSLQLELHLLMVHLLMVHLPMVHLHVLHLLAMHLIGLQLVQCIDTPTVVFRLQLIMHHCKPLGGSKQELEESKCDEEKNSWRHPCLGQQHP